jgi:anti-sigma regulatory factor (Ser/Thr protein kinase)
MRDDVRGAPPAIRLMRRTAFPATGESVGAARRWLRGILDGHPRCDDAVLLLSEAVANSIVHTRSAAIGAVVLVERRNRLQIEVIDEGGTTWPSVCRCARGTGPEPAAETGRGIGLIRALSSQWGFSEERPHCVLWFTLDP